jgi:hypothetical protein
MKYNWSTEEENIIKNKYKTLRRGVKELLPLLPGRSERAIILKAKKMGIRRDTCGMRFLYDFDFWKIYNPVNCYWAGMVAADGCIYQNKNLDSYTFSFGLQEKYQIEKFVEDTKSEYAIHNKPVRENEAPMYYARYTASKEWQSDLKNNFNIAPRKSWNMPAPTQIPKDLFKYFLIGFIDGDGHIAINKRKGSGSSCFVFKIALATREVLDYIKEWADVEYPSPTKRSVRNYCCEDKIYYHFTIGGLAACKMYLSLRQLIPEKHLSRKWDVPEYVDYCEKRVKASQDKQKSVTHII